MCKLKASLPASVGASVGAVKTAVDACVTAVTLVEDEAWTEEFLGDEEESGLVTELKVWAL